MPAGTKFLQSSRARAQRAMENFRAPRLGVLADQAGSLAAGRLIMPRSVHFNQTKYMKYPKWRDERPDLRETVAGSSLTIPGQAPTLKQLIESMLQGIPLPQVGRPMYDDSEEAGEARLMSNDTPIVDTVTDLRSAQSAPNPTDQPQPAATDEAAPANEDEAAQ